MNGGHRQQGFTLTELAIVLAIIAFMLGGLLGPLGAQRETQRRQDNRELLELAREALIGFAITNKRLPCPDLTTPERLATGLETLSCQSGGNAFYVGRLPWVTLDIDADTDPWGEPHYIRYAVNGAYTNAFDLNTVSTAGGELRIFDSAPGAAVCAGTAGNVADDVPAIVWSTAENITGSTLEQENLDGDRCFTLRDYQITGGANDFDDQMIWLSPNVLFNRLVSAGVLP